MVKCANAKKALSEMEFPAKKIPALNVPKMLSAIGLQKRNL